MSPASGSRLICIIVCSWLRIASYLLLVTVAVNYLLVGNAHIIGAWFVVTDVFARIITWNASRKLAASVAAPYIS
jgi:hypothetical protein